LKSDDDAMIDPLDTLLAEEIPPLPPTAPDGTFVPTLIQPEPIPEATPETMACLRGPCRFYVEIKSRFQHGNTKGTLDHEPVQINRFCKAIQGTDIDLTDELVHDCNHWDPMDSSVVSELNLRRIRWARENGKENA
jgi:hypothetical protein